MKQEPYPVRGENPRPSGRGEVNPGEADCGTCGGGGLVETGRCNCGGGPATGIPGSPHEPLCGAEPCPEGCWEKLHPPIELREATP